MTPNRVAIVVSRWNEAITDRLLTGATSALNQAGIRAEQIDVISVSGAYELPQSCAILARTLSYRAIVPLGCLMRGETLHYEMIAHAVATGLDAVGRESGVPVTLGVLAVDTFEQAWERSGGTEGNKGEEAARAALELARLREEVLGHARSLQSA